MDDDDDVLFVAMLLYVSVSITGLNYSEKDFATLIIMSWGKVFENQSHGYSFVTNSRS